MKKEEERTNTTQQQNINHPDVKGVAQNPNPRANENIRNREDKRGEESAEIEDEVGTEITDGEDA